MHSERTAGRSRGGHKAPVNPLDPAYMTLADLNNQDAFGAVQRGGGGGGYKAPIHPRPGFGGGQKQNKAPVAANDPLYMTLANVRNDVFDDKMKPAAPRPPTYMNRQARPIGSPVPRQW